MLFAFNNVFLSSNKKSLKFNSETLLFVLLFKPKKTPNYKHEFKLKLLLLNAFLFQSK